MLRPRLKPFNRTVDGDRLTLTTDPGITFQIEDPDGSNGQLLDLLDGTRTIDQIALPGFARAEIAEGIAALDEAGLLEDAAAAPLQDPERYFNNLAFFGTFADLKTSQHQFQQRLADARVLQIGAGGVGSTVLLQLVGLGVGEIRLVEFDRIERKNLSRQLLYTEAQVGQPKLDAAVARAQELNAAVRVTPITQQITGPADLAALLDGVDLLVLTADSPAQITDWANTAAVKAGVPFITGGVGIARASYYSVAPGKSACLACLRAQERRGGGPIQHPDGIHRGINPVGGLVASLISLEALRYLTGFAAPVSAARYWQVDLASGRTEVALAWERTADCPVCGSHRTALGAVETIHQIRGLFYA